MKQSDRALGRPIWTLTVVTLAMATTLTMTDRFAAQRWDDPTLLFGLLTTAAALCIVAATIVIALGDRRELAEIGLLGSVLMAASVMPMVNGLVTPGVLFDETAAFATSSFLTLPVAVVVGSPLLAPHSAFGRWAARQWRDWTLLSLLGVFVLAALVVAFPDAIAAPGARNLFTVALSTGLVVVVGSFSLRQLRLYELGRGSAHLIASISIAMLAPMALAPLTDPSSPAFWWLHGAGAAGVVGTCLALGVSKRLSAPQLEVLSPILTRDPLVAFELGLSASVRDFVAGLELEDEVIRDHVIRTAELAMRVGERFRLPARAMRDLGLAAMLHDVGKVHLSQSILSKPGRLTAADYEQVKLHPVRGEAMLRREPALASVASIVRSHHERFDGRGYPDGLAGRVIPLASRIIAVCDSLDAMTHDRPHRSGMPLTMAFAILRENAGSQWDEAVVDQVVSLVSTMSSVPTFDEVGFRGPSGVSMIVPDDISELLMAVDAEI